MFYSTKSDCACIMFERISFGIHLKRWFCDESPKEGRRGTRWQLKWKATPFAALLSCYFRRFKVILLGGTARILNNEVTDLNLSVFRSIASFMFSHFRARSYVYLRALRWERIGKVQMSNTKHAPTLIKQLSREGNVITRKLHGNCIREEKTSQCKGGGNETLR